MRDYISLVEAAKLAPGRPHAASVWRWCRKGIKSRCGRRIKLEHVRIGGRLFIAKGALEQFFRKVSESDCEYFATDAAPPASKRPTTTQRHRSVKAAEATLREAGIA